MTACTVRARPFRSVFNCIYGISNWCLRQKNVGDKEAVTDVIKLTQGKGDINTAFIERLNGTFRGCLNSLARRTRSLSRQSKTLQSGMYLVGSVYNFCVEQESLRLPGLIGATSGLNGHQRWLAALRIIVGRLMNCSRSKSRLQGGSRH